ncbi:hypothetical protein [Pararhizobium sp.]|uniref:hypothetical protein n=1 Tax=Pararhizobium sp. TaxID=1977563 RepID=UPI003D0B6DE3
MTDDHDKAIGALEAKVEQLTSAVNLHAEESRSVAEESRSARSKHYQQLEEIRLEASHTARSIKELHEWKPQVDEKLRNIERWKERGIGAWLVISGSAGIIAAAILFAWNWILARLGLA